MVIGRYAITYTGHETARAARYCYPVPSVSPRVRGILPGNDSRCDEGGGVSGFPGGGRRDRQPYIHTRIVAVLKFIQVDFHDSVIVQPQPFAECILRDLESPIRISAKGGRKEKMNRQREVRLL
jgi:hypothetical protein